jgi:hypothetical protein
MEQSQASSKLIDPKLKGLCRTSRGHAGRVPVLN